MRSTRSNLFQARESARLLASAPALVAHNSCTLPQRDELVCGNLLILFVQTIGPVNVEIDRTESTQAKMQAGIRAGAKKRKVEDRLRLHLAAITSHHTPSGRAAGCLDSPQFVLGPFLSVFFVLPYL